jgi:nicotinamidase-related amidase
MLIDRERSALLVIDMQERLLPAIHDGASVTSSVAWLVRLAQRLGVPVAATEHYPEGLGATTDSLRDLIPADAVASKRHFSSVAAGCLARLPGSDRPQLVLAGCVQTALDLQAAGRHVFVVGDAVGSRRPADRDCALARMRQDGVRIVSREMVAFEWLREGGTALFRDINRDFLRDAGA